MASKKRRKKAAKHTGLAKTAHWLASSAAQTARAAKVLASHVGKKKAKKKTAKKRSKKASRKR